MEIITRKDIDGICELLRTNNSEELGDKLEKADIVPKLYQFAYVESLYNILSKCKTLDDFKEKFKYSYNDERYTLEKENTFDGIKQILYKAHERQGEICDFADSPLPEHSSGRCQDENHYESIEDKIEFTEEEQEKFDEIKDKEGWNEACEYFNDKTNPDHQKLTLILNFGDDETKVLKDDGYYVCDDCLEVISENSEGNISCDLEMAEGNEI